MESYQKSAKEVMNIPIYTLQQIEIKWSTHVCNYTHRRFHVFACTFFLISLIYSLLFSDFRRTIQLSIISIELKVTSEQSISWESIVCLLVEPNYLVPNGFFFFNDDEICQTIMLILLCLFFSFLIVWIHLNIHTKYMWISHILLATI